MSVTSVGEIENIDILCERVLLHGNGKCGADIKFMKHGYFYISRASRIKLPLDAYISALLTLNENVKRPL